MNKILALALGLTILSISQPSQAKPKQENSILDSHTKQIIYNRLCNAFRSEQYTYEEISSSAESMIVANGNLSTANYGIDNIYMNSLTESNKIANERAVAREKYNLMNSVIKNKDCWKNGQYR